MRFSPSGGDSLHQTALMKCGHISMEVKPPVQAFHWHSQSRENGRRKIRRYDENGEPLEVFFDDAMNILTEEEANNTASQVVNL
eukprot:scaffold13049_cov19-Tisochrysis_lutea.AAC.1